MVPDKLASLNRYRHSALFTKPLGRCSSVFLLYLFLHISACGSQEPENVSLNETPIRELSDTEILDWVETGTFEYFWSGAETNSGLIRERIHLDDPNLDQHLITTGGTGFGLMVLLAGIERKYITRKAGFDRLQQIVDFLDTIPRFHGVWAHWYDGATGEVVPFSPRDNGGDLVETSFLVQGLLCVRQYFNNGNDQEKALAQQIDRLWKGVEWDFYRGPEKENVLFWHWSPEYTWDMNFKITGYNETLVTYILAASSPTHSIPAEVYHGGWADGGRIVERDTTRPLRLVHQGEEVLGGPLFWAHYSFLGLNPQNLQDRYVHYWDHNVKHVLLNRQYCIDNPLNFKGYGHDLWGLTASYSINFYAAHSPKNDVGVITPSAALSSFPYTPTYSMDVLRNLRSTYKASLWGPYGFYDAFSVDQNWFPKQYLAIDQGPIVVMIENHRSGLLWDLFMSCQEVEQGLNKLEFTY